MTTPIAAAPRPSNSRPRLPIIFYTLTLIIALFALTYGLAAMVAAAPLRDFSMAIISLVIIRWWAALAVNRSGRRWIWQVPRPANWIDALVALWLAVIVFSWLANGLDNRRSMIGAWYDGLALLALLLLADLIRRGVPRRWFIDALLLAGVFWIILGFLLCFIWLMSWLPTRGSGLPFSPIRPTSIFNNANSFATPLLALLFLSLARLANQKRWIGRIGWGIYVLLALVLLALTQSRGAWVGAAGGILAGLVLIVHNTGVRLNRRQIAVIAAVVVVSGLVVAAFVLPPLLGISVHSDNRPDIYRIAIQSFFQRPLLGHGPDSFGLQLLENQSIPPESAHIHAHDVPLNVAVEFGIPGVVALFLTLLLGVRLYWRNLTQSTVKDRALWIGLGVVNVAIAVHGLFDVTAVQPSIFLMDIGLFALAVAPDPSPITKKELVDPQPLRWLAWSALGIGVGLSCALLIGGWLSAAAYDDYWAGIQAIGAQPFPAGWVTAQPLLAKAAARDPLSAITVQAAAYADGLLAAINHDAPLRAQAIREYEQTLTLEAPNAVGWLNLAMLYQQDGRQSEANHAAEQVAYYANASGLMLINSGLILEQNGQIESAASVYRTALKVRPDWSNQAFWQQTDLRRAVLRAHQPPPTDTQRIFSLLDAGQVDQAKQVATAFRANNSSVAEPYLDQALLLIRTHGDLNTASALVKAAIVNFDVFHDWAWFHYVQAELDAARGDAAGHDRELVAAGHDPIYDQNGLSIDVGNVAIPAYFMQDIPRQLLPGAWYPTLPPELFADF